MMIGKAFTLIAARWQVSLAVLAVLLLALGGAYLKGRSDGVKITEAKYAAIAAQALAQARKADEAAHAAVTAGNASVAASNEAAREAARNSDDPLAAALESIRSGH